MKITSPLLLTLLLIFTLFSFGCREHATGISNLEDARQAKIGVMTGSTGETLAGKRFPEAHIKSFDDIMDAVAAMKSGQLDAIITAYPAALQTTKKNPELQILAEALDNEDTAIAIRQDSPALLAAVNRIISDLRDEGRLADMKRRWFKPDLSPYEQISITLPAQGEVLKVGVSATREPFSFVDENGQVSGHDGELARLIAARLNRPIEFANMKFMALIPALQSGKVDLIITGMTATEERKKFVNFSQPYFANQQVMLVKKNPIQAATPAAQSISNSVSDNDSINNLSDLNNRRIAVLSGSAGDIAARQQFKNAHFDAMTAAADAALAVKTHKADAFVYDKSVLMNLVDKNPQLQILPQPVAKLAVAAALSKDNRQLRSEINAALTQFRDSGLLTELKNKWIDNRYSTPPAISVKNNGDGKAVLRMGTCATIEPFSFQANGVLTGLDIELAQLIGQTLGKKVEIIDMNFEALIPALQAGKIDFALSNFNVTEERKQLVLFSQAYIENDISALVRSPKAGSVAPPLSSLNDLTQQRIAVLMGSAHDTYATSHYPNATILQYKSPADVALAVKSGKADAALFDEQPLREIMRHDDSFALLGDSLFSFDVGIGFSQQHPELRDQFNAFLQQIRNNGIYDDMIRRWMSNGDTQMPVIASATNNGELVIGVSDTGFPFTLVKDNQLIGFDVELAQRFAAASGKRVKFSNMDFGSLIAAVSTGKIDMIASSLYITDERKQQINFSEPYYQMATRVFILKSRLQNRDEPANGAPAITPSFTDKLIGSFNSNILQEKRYLLLWDGLKTTVIISVFATLFGTLLGSLICFMRLSPNPLLQLPARLYITLIRGTPVLVLLMLTFYVVFASVDINPVLVAVIAFGINFAAYVSEIFRTGIESIDKGQIEAGIAMGFSRFKTFLYIVLPQTLQRILPVYKGEFISLVKMTSIVGYIAVQDLTKASDIIRSRTFDAFFPLIMVAALYFLISWVLMQSLEYLERVTDPKYQRSKRVRR